MKAGWVIAAAVMSALGLGVLQAENAVTNPDLRHWAFRPPVRVEPPTIAGAENAIDRFLLARLAELGLSFSPVADRRTLIRRASYDLTGLPPSPGEVDAFLADTSPVAYDRLIDRLLASPAYGERWAQHWLDVVRFAETDGFEHDAVRPDAWRYRDWVIAAFNADLPYNRFIELQLAADEVAPGEASDHVATGFLLAGPDMPDINDPDERRHTYLNGITATVGETFLALTLGCAQCHDHKTDPISIEDFYRLRAVFSNAVTRWKRDVPLGHLVAESGPEAPPDFVMLRGDFRRRGDPVEPAFIRVLNPAGIGVAPAGRDAQSSMRRAALAQWLTRPDHPLTARVMVNRLWQHHFGAGLVESSGDFGQTGDAPTHPALLDWLATELPARGWSLKEMHRLIMSSRAYRQVSRGQGESWAAALKRDPLNQLVSRMSRRRLDGESIRDAFLTFTGHLNRDAGGPGVRPPLPKEVAGTLLRDQWETTPDEAAHRRRSIYVFARRNLRYPIFEAFDRPDANVPCPRRYRSTTAPQSLMLLNSEFSLATARALAARVSADGASPSDQIHKLHALIFSRLPDAQESAMGLEFLAGAPLVDYCLALLNTNETIYID